MKWKSFREGLKVFDKYIDDGEYAICAEHDQLFVGPPGTSNEINDEDKARLQELGWHYDDEVGSWFAFT